MRRVRQSMIGTSLALLALGCAGVDLPSAVIVEATDQLQFAPSQTRLAAGGQVTWRAGTVAHNVTFTAGTQGPADVADLAANTSATRQFPTAGTFTYECQIHPGMSGRVVVEVEPPDDPSGPY